MLDSLSRYFDAVVMLTWSNWKTEPRSNRYHYASRFARSIPVYFVQPDSVDGKVSLEVVENNITLVHVSSNYGAEQADSLIGILSGLGVRRPLNWIYNPQFEHYIRRSSGIVNIFHATEDYFGNTKNWAMADISIRDNVRRVLERVDILVGVSQGVLDSYISVGGYRGEHILLENGCDASFWRDSCASDYQLPQDGARVAFYQGGINKRLDFDLLKGLARRLAHWQFWFCGAAHSADEGWCELLSLPNVRYFGEQEPAGVARLSRHARVGLIPFHQDDLIRRSLPLKAFEYVACGMPVVSVPIDALASRPNLFQIAQTADEFANAIEAVGDSRLDESAVSLRREAAFTEDYDARFALLLDFIDSFLTVRMRSPQPAYNIALLYDVNATHVLTTREYMEAFKKHSGHNIVFMPATQRLPKLDDVGGQPDFTPYDAVILHYSVRLSIEDFISPGIVKGLKSYGGPKILFIQDEYESTETARRWIEKLGIDTVFTVVPTSEVEKVYPKARFPGVDFVSTLTGFVPEDSSLDRFALPLKQRSVLIGYRGRPLPYQYGALGQEKYDIGIKVRQLAEARGLPVDIEVDHEHRIYGDGWYRFVGSCRSTLGTESGANVFDDDGELKRLAHEHAAIPFEEFSERFLRGHEGKVRMNQISPKIFEAIRLRTALVLFEGDYSGVVKAGVHYLALKKDYSNFDEIIKKLSSDEFVEELTSRAYEDVIESEVYSYRSFIRLFNDYLQARLKGRPARAFLINPPIMAFYGKNDVSRLWPMTALSGLAGGAILGDALPRDTVLEAVDAFMANAMLHDGSVDMNGLLKGEETRNIARAQDGAFISSSSAFFPRPNDADYILRPEVQDGYAAAFETADETQFIEIDFGAERVINKIRLVWLSFENRGIDYTLHRRNAGSDGWTILADIVGSEEVEHDLTFTPIATRQVRLAVTRFHGQRRILLRRFDVMGDTTPLPV